MGKKQSKIGRPRDEVKRMALSLRVTPTVRKLLDNAAAEAGRSISQEAEMMIERAIQYDRMFEAMKRTAEQIQQGNLEAELVRVGYELYRHPEYGKAWLSPGFPGERSGFITPPEKE